MRTIKIALLLLISTSYLVSCSIQKNEYNGFKKHYIYENKTELFLETNKSAERRYLSQIRDIERKMTKNILFKGERVLITEIYRIYPDTSGVTLVTGEILSGKFKGVKVILGVNMDKSLFEDLGRKEN